MLTALQRLGEQTFRALRLDRPVHTPVDRAFRLAARYWPVALLAIWALLYLPILGDRPLRFEEGRRAAQAMAILFDGDWWRLDIGGQPYTAKPPLLPWLMALVAMARGTVDEIAVRLPAILAVLGGALSAGYAAHALTSADDRRFAAFCAGIAFLCMPFIVTMGRIGETDTTATFLAGLALMIWLVARTRGEVSVLAWIGVGAALAGAGFAKGPAPMVFSIVAIAAITIASRKPREFAGLALALAVSALPLLIWLWFNEGRTNAAHLADEMRLTVFDDLGAYALTLLRLGEIPIATLLLLPWIVPIALWLWRNRRDGNGWSWQVTSLLIAAVPVAIVILLWPESRERYAMPIVWPVAVLAGLAISGLWTRNRFAGVILVSGMIFAVIFQAVTFFAIEGKTHFQRERRDLVTNLSEATANAEGRILFLSPHRRPDFNIFAYARHPMLQIRPEAVACPPEANLLVSEGPDRHLPQQSTLWSERASLADGAILVFERTSAAPKAGACDMVPDPLVTPEFLAR